MYAIKKHINKALAAFLCACLLLSYNPAFGTDYAWADPLSTDTPAQETLDDEVAQSVTDGVVDLSDVAGTEGNQFIGGNATIDGNTVGASTFVKATTYNGEFRTEATEPFSASIEQLANKTIPTTGYIGVKAIGGSTIADLDEHYDFVWTAYVNGVEDVDLTDLINGDYMVNGATDKGAGYSHLKIQDLAKDEQLVEGKQYTFVCTVTDGNGQTVTETVTVFTTPKDATDNEQYSKDTLEGKPDTDLDGVKVDAFVLDGIDSDNLVGSKAPDDSDTKAAMVDTAGRDSNTDGTYAIKDVYELNITGGKDAGDGLTLPPFLNEDFVLELPIDPEYNGYKPGDSATVLWKGDTSDKVQKVTGTVVEDEDGNLKVQITYPYSEDKVTLDENGKPIEGSGPDGIDDTGWPALPGAFAIEYDNTKNENPEHKTDYYSVTVVNASKNPGQPAYGTVSPAGTSGTTYFEVGTTAAYAMKGAIFTSSNGTSAMYQVQKVVLFKNSKTGGATLVNNYERTAEGLKADTFVSPTRDTFTLNAQNSAGKNDVYYLQVTFAKNEPATPTTFKLNAKVVTQKALDSAANTNGQKPTLDATDDAKNGKLYALYTNASGIVSLEPSSGIDGTETITNLEVGNPGKSVICLLPKVQEGKTFVVKGARVRVQNTDGTWPDQWGWVKLDGDQFDLSSYTTDVEVEFAFGESTSGVVLPPASSYTMTLGVDDAAHGEISPSGIQPMPTSAVGENVTLVAKDGYYPTAATITVGTGDDAYELQLALNSDKNTKSVSFRMPPFNANVVVTGNFTSVADSSYTLKTATKGAVGSVIPDLTAGQTVHPGETYYFTFMPTRDTLLDKVTVTATVSSDESTEPLTVNSGNTVAYLVPDNLDNDSTILITAEFKTKSTLPSTTEKWTVKTYVADKDEPLDNLSFEATTSLDGYTGNGTVTPNGEMEVPDGENVDLTFKPAEGYEVEKLALYSFDKEGDGSVDDPYEEVTLNTRNYVLQSVDSNTLVIVFFKEAYEPGDEDTDGKIPELPGYSDSDYVTVTLETVSAGEGGGVGSIYPEGGTASVLKGHSLPLQFVATSGEFTGATVKKADGTTVDTTENEFYTLEDITEPLTVTATFYKDKDDEPIIPKHDFSAAAEGEGTVKYNNGDVPSEIVDEGSVVLTISPNDEEHELTGLSLEYTKTREAGDGSTSTIDAYYNISGDYPVIAFTYNPSEPEGSNWTKITVEALPEVLVDAVKDKNNLLEINNVLSAVTLTATFGEGQGTVTKYQTITAKVKEGSTGLGVINIQDPDGNFYSTNVVTVAKGSESPMFLFTPVPGYKIDTITINSSSLWENIFGFISGSTAGEEAEAVATSKYKFKSVINNDYIIEVSFAKDTSFTDDPVEDQVVVNVIYNDAYGSVSPSGTTLITKNTGVETFRVKPALDETTGKYYKIEDVKFNGTSKPASNLTTSDNWYVFELKNVTANSTLEVVFSTSTEGDGGSSELPPVIDDELWKNVQVVSSRYDASNSVVSDSGVGGIVSPSGNVEVQKDKTKSIRVIPTDKYVVQGVYVDDSTTPVGSDSPYYVGPGGGTITIGSPYPTKVDVRFKLKSFTDLYYKITASVTGNTGGTITPAGEMYVPGGQSESYLIVAAAGHKISSVKDNGVEKFSGSNTKAFHYTVTSQRADNRYVDHELVVTFVTGTSSGSEPTTTKVRAYVYGDVDKDDSGVISVWPGTDTIKAEKNKPFLYTFCINDEYRGKYIIYKVEANGTKAPQFQEEDKITDGFYLFDSLPRANNSLKIYVKALEDVELPDGGDEWTIIGGTNNEDLGGVSIGTGKSFGSTKIRSAALASTSSDVAFEEQLSMGAIATARPGEPVGVLISAKDGARIKKAYFYNCVYIDSRWCDPDDFENDEKDGNSIYYEVELTGPYAFIFGILEEYDASDPTQDPHEFDPSDIDDFALTKGDDNHTDTVTIEIIPPADSEGDVVSELIKSNDDVVEFIKLAAPDAPVVKLAEEEDYRSPEITHEDDSYTLKYMVATGNKIDGEISSLFTFTDKDKGEIKDYYTIEEIWQGDKEIEFTGIDNTQNKKITLGADDDEEEGDEEGESEETPEPQTYYEGYKFSTEPNEDGELDTTPITIGLKKLSDSEIENGKFVLLNPPNTEPVNPGPGDDNPGPGNENENKTVRISVNAGNNNGGVIEPVSIIPAVPAWFDKNEGPWDVTRGTSVSFRVTPNQGFYVNTLTLINNNSLQTSSSVLNSLRDGIITFTASENLDVTSMTLSAVFLMTNPNPEMRNITIRVYDGHGTTKPEPGVHQEVKGRVFPIEFQPDDGYVPYWIQVNNTGGYISPTLSGWVLPGTYSDQEFVIRYAPAGTTPSNGTLLVQTGQNALTDAATGLVRTGDNPVAVACIVGVAVLAAAGVWQVRRRKATAARAAKYSVTKRK